MRLRRAVPILCTLLLLACTLAPAIPAAAQEGGRTTGDDPRIDTRLFHIALVLAEKGGGERASGDLPRGVAAALDDVRDFLPYDRYRVVDSAIVRTNRNATVGLSGPDGEPYRAQLFALPIHEGGREIIDVRGFELARQPQPLAVVEGSGEGRAVAPEAPPPPLNASFRMTPGETVIVGSSRLNGGNRALIVLLTAVE